MTKVYVVLEELDDPWYGDGNITKLFFIKKEADEWIENGKDKPEYHRPLHIEEFDIV